MKLTALCSLAALQVGIASAATLCGSTRDCSSVYFTSRKDCHCERAVNCANQLAATSEWDNVDLFSTYLEEFATSVGPKPAGKDDFDACGLTAGLDLVKIGIGREAKNAKISEFVLALEDVCAKGEKYCNPLKDKIRELKETSPHKVFHFLDAKLGTIFPRGDWDAKDFPKEIRSMKAEIDAERKSKKASEKASAKAAKAAASGKAVSSENKKESESELGVGAKIFEALSETLENIKKVQEKKLESYDPTRFDSPTGSSLYTEPSVDRVRRLMANGPVLAIANHADFRYYQRVVAPDDKTGPWGYEPMSEADARQKGLQSEKRNYEALNLVSYDSLDGLFYIESPYGVDGDLLPVRIRRVEAVYHNTATLRNPPRLVKQLLHDLPTAPIVVNAWQDDVTFLHPVSGQPFTPVNGWLFKHAAATPEVVSYEEPTASFSFLKKPRPVLRWRFLLRIVGYNAIDGSFQTVFFPSPGDRQSVMIRDVISHPIFQPATRKDGLKWHALTQWGKRKYGLTENDKEYIAIDEEDLEMPDAEYYA